MQGSAFGIQFIDIHAIIQHVFMERQSFLSVRQYIPEGPRTESLKTDPVRHWKPHSG